MAAFTFHQALVQAEAQARSTLDVALHERLAAATALVKDGRVFQTSTGDWQVDSSSQAGLTYSVNGTCSCDDHHYNKPRWCKHQLAMFLSQRVCTLLHQPAQPVVPEVVEPWGDNDFESAPASPQGETQGVPPAPTRERAGMRLEAQVLMGGRMVKVAVWGPDDADVQQRLATVLQQYPVAQPVSQLTDATPSCPTHGALKRSAKGRGWYCPSKNDDDTWCKSKAP